MSRLTKNYSITLLFIVLILINYIVTPKLIVVQIFSILFVLLIHIKYSDSTRKQLFYLTIVFSMVNYSLSFQVTSRNSMYFSYISIILYYFIIMCENINKLNKIKYKDFISNKYKVFFVIFIIYCTLSLFFIKNIRLGMNTYISYVIMFLSIIMIYNETKSLKDFQTTFKLLLYILGGILLLGTMEVLGVRLGIQNNYYDLGIESIAYFSKIPIVFFYNQNNYAVFLVLAMSGLFISYFCSKSKTKKNIYLVLYIISQINLIFTTSRIGWISIFSIFVFTFIVSFLIKDKRTRDYSIRFALLTFVIFFIVSFMPAASIYYGKFSSTPFLKMLNIRVNTNSNNINIINNNVLKVGEGGSINERYTLLSDIVKGVISERNYFGFGVGNTMNYIRSLDNTHDIVNPHSLWFEILGDFGLFIFIYYLYIYLSFIIDSIKLYRQVSEEWKKYILIISSSCFSFVLLAFGPSSVIAYFPFFLLMGLSGSLIGNINKLK
jgi:teichuronic acid biosynthesis protein TuaE